MNITSDRRRQRSDINRFFEFLAMLCHKNVDENVAVYGLKRAAGVLIRPDNWPLFEAHICTVAMAHPNAIEFVAKVLFTYNYHKYPVNRGRIARLCNRFIEDHAGLAHHSEVAWALWICKDLDLPLKPEAVASVSQMRSSVCALILLELESIGKLPIPVDVSVWGVTRTSAALWDDMWLLSYEAGMRAWSGFNNTHIAGDRHFNELKSRSIHFYDQARTLKPLFTVDEVALRLKSGEQSSIDLEFFDRTDAEEFIEFQEDDGEYGDADEDEDEEEELSKTDDDGDGDLF